jgi:hypothetical protein
MHWGPYALFGGGGFGCLAKTTRSRTCLELSFCRKSTAYILAPLELWSYLEVVEKYVTLPHIVYRLFVSVHHIIGIARPYISVPQINPSHYRDRKAL